MTPGISRREEPDFYQWGIGNFANPEFRPRFVTTAGGQRSGGGLGCKSVTNEDAFRTKAGKRARKFGEWSSENAKLRVQ